MIASLRGRLIEKHPNQAVIECAGVGYDVAISVSTFSALPDPGAEVALKTYTNVREDAIQLFGFSTAEEKLLFEKLISVSGIGPKLAITALSGLPAAELAGAIRGGAVEQLVRIPGIGKKTAERLVLELRDKLDLLAAASPARAPDKARGAFSAVEEDVISALLNFGATRAAAEAAVVKARGGDDAFEPLFRRALKLLR
jgi:Holliday junction DNA helicase RuvA